MRRLRACRAVSLALFVSLTAIACSAGGGQTGAPPFASPSTQNAGVQQYDLQQNATAAAHITEYPVASGVAPKDITAGAYGNAWFASFPAFDTSTLAAESVNNSGGFSPKNVPTGLYSGSGSIARIGAYVYAVATDPSNQDESLLLRSTASGSFAVIGDLGVCCGSPVTKMIEGPDGNLWLTVCNESCGSGSAFVEKFTPGGTRLLQLLLGDLSQSVTYLANGIAAGPDGNLYVTASYTGPPGGTAPDSSVFKISTAGTILNQFVLPVGSFPFGIVAGPDGNLWITDNGTGAISRMTTAGATKQYPLSSSTAAPAMITVGTDGALWFTKTNANAIGRITTWGVLGNYKIPTANSMPFGIASPASCSCTAKIWFTEQSGKIGKLTI